MRENGGREGGREREGKGEGERESLRECVCEREREKEYFGFTCTRCYTGLDVIERERRVGEDIKFQRE